MEFSILATICFLTIWGCTLRGVQKVTQKLETSFGPEKTEEQEPRWRGMWCALNKKKVVLTLLIPSMRLRHSYISGFFMPVGRVI
jgi:hypothetical protein